MLSKSHHLILIGILCAALGGCGSGSKNAKEETAPSETDEKETKPAWKSLFDGKSLDGWEVIDYAGHGPTEVKDGVLVISQGELLSGVRYTKGAELPKVNYEVELEARRMMGTDFFCCLTFPYKESHASYVVGGWGGSVVGISSIDNMDAYDNETNTVQEFDDEKWYKIRLRPTDDRIQAWIGDEKVVNVGLKDREVSMRFGEIEDSVPFGLSTFTVTAEMRNIRIRELTPAEIDEAAKMKGEYEL